MARPRTYRHDIRCPHCGGHWMPKDGTTPQGRQIYRCGKCQRRYQPDAAYHRPAPAVKEPALAMYCEGSSCRAIGRILGYSGQSVGNWVKKGARAVIAQMRERSCQRTEGPAGLAPPPGGKGGRPAGHATVSPVRAVTLGEDGSRAARPARLCASSYCPAIENGKTLPSCSLPTFRRQPESGVAADTPPAKLPEKKPSPLTLKG